MTETTTYEPPEFIDFEDLHLEIERGQSGLRVKVISGDQTEGLDAEPIAQADFGYGYGLGYDETTRRYVTDEHVFSLGNVENYSNIPGLATKLTKFGIEEAKSRNFALARAGIHNPRIVSIIEKLKTEGHIKERHYYPSVSPDIENNEMEKSTSELLEHGHEVNPESAIEFFDGFESYKDGFVDGATVDCIIEL